MAIMFAVNHPVIFLAFLICFFGFIGLLFDSNEDNKPAKKVKPAIKPIVKAKKYQPEVINPRRYNSL